MTDPKDLKVFRLNGRSIIFISPEGETFFAAKRVANEILSYQMGGDLIEVFIQEWKGQKWLATPSRF